MQIFPSLPFALCSLANCFRLLFSRPGPVDVDSLPVFLQGLVQIHITLPHRPYPQFLGSCTRTKRLHMNWRTKPTDRFVLRFIKVYVSAPVSTALVRILPDVSPSALTLLAACLGVCGGIFFGLGLAWLGGLLAAAAQVLDGVDGQVARLTSRESMLGAFLDSVLDRYMDFSLIFGILLHCLRFSQGVSIGGIVLSSSWLIVIAGLAAAGSSQVSYATARATTLALDYQRPEYAGKGSRTAVILVCGLLTPVWVHSPLVALVYLALHPNIAVLLSLLRLYGKEVGGH